MNPQNKRAIDYSQMSEEQIMKKFKIVSFGVAFYSIIIFLIMVVATISNPGLQETGFANLNSEPFFIYLKMILWSIGIGSIVFAYFLRKKNLLKWQNNFTEETPNYGIYMRGIFTSHAICELFALFGMLIYLLSGGFIQMSSIMIITLVAQIGLMPKAKDWQ